MVKAIGGFRSGLVRGGITNMVFQLARDFHEAVTAMPIEHQKHRMLELLEEATCSLSRQGFRCRIS